MKSGKRRLADYLVYRIPDDRRQTRDEGRRTTSGDHGFVFLEVMLAVTFFSISIIYILSAFSKSVMLTQKSINQFMAMGFLEEKINELTIENSGYLSGKENKYYWNVNFLERKNNLDEITYNVGWEEGKNRGSITVITYLCKKAK